MNIRVPTAISVEMIADDRGYGFYGIFQEIAKKYNMCFEQYNLTFTRPGAARVGHKHVNQDDVMIVVSGDAIIVTMRRDENGEIDTYRFCIGEHNPKAVIIPRGFWHGVSSADPQKGFVLAYGVTKSYDKDNLDEQRFTGEDPELEKEFNRLLGVQNK